MSTSADCPIPVDIDQQRAIAPFVRAIAARLTSVAALVRHWRDRRRTLRAVDALDDWLLRDIGVERTELRRTPADGDIVRIVGLPAPPRPETWRRR